MAWGSLLFRIVLAFENEIVTHILRRPGWHRGVGRIHKFVDEKRYGRNPNEPLAQGEATSNPESRGFLTYFKDELLNQARGKPTDFPNDAPTKMKKK